MKKILVLFSCIGLMTLAGCTKNNDSNPSLTGTTWVYNYSETTDAGLVEYNNTLFFTSRSSVTFSTKELLNGDVKATFRETGTYKYTPPIIKFTGEMLSTVGTINENLMTIEIAGISYVFEKQ